MKREEFEFLASLLKRGSGLSLTPEKIELIASRVKAVAERQGFGTIPTLVQALRSGHEPLARLVIEAATTRDTSFFRDCLTFDALRDEILPAVLRARFTTRRLLLWCAPAATGQAPDSVRGMIAAMPQFAG